MQRTTVNKKLHTLLILLLTLLITLNFPLENIKAEYNGSQTIGVRTVTSGWSWGANAGNTLTAMYICDLDGNPVTPVVGLYSTAPGDTNESGNCAFRPPSIAIEIGSYHQTVQLLAREYYIPGLPTPVVGGGDSFVPNGDAVEAWLTSQNSKGDYKYEEVLFYCRDALGAGTLKEVMNNRDDYVIVLEPMTWLGAYVNNNKSILTHRYLEAGTEDDWVEEDYVVFTSAYGWANFYENLGIFSGGIARTQSSGDIMMCAMTHEALPGMTLEKEYFGLSPHPHEAMRRLSNSEIMSSGYGIHVIPFDTIINTYDAKHGSPGKPEDPGETKKGKSHIVKVYYDKIIKDNKVTYKHVQTYYQPDVVKNIRVMDEPNEYALKHWDVSTTVNPSILSTTDGKTLTYYNDLPAKVTDSGSNPTLLELDNKAGEKCVYVLLERVIKMKTNENDPDYIITESRITRGIEETTSSLGITSFKWEFPDLKSCGLEEEEVDGWCDDDCPKGCTEDHDYTTSHSTGALSDPQVELLIL